MQESTYKKSTQALNYLARKKGGKINKMKAIKLIYLADRLHLRKYGRPIVGDVYWAMKLGPVGSETKRVAELDVSGVVLAYAHKYLQPTDEKKQYIASRKEVDTTLFSETDLECLESIYTAYGDMDQFELAEITHGYSEWKKHEPELRAGKKRVQMQYGDFFADLNKNDVIFAQKDSALALAKEAYAESVNITTFFAH